MVNHAVTFDVEDWHQLVSRRITGQAQAPTANVITDTRRVLELLAEVGVRATFFVVGQVAATYPELVREVAEQGHEIGSHTYSHELIHRLEPAAFKRDMQRSVKILEDLTGRPVWGFRAPEFSVGHLRHWCFEILAELGFRYDSSVFPWSRVRYGIPDAPLTPFVLDTPQGALTEFPLAIWDMGRFRLPVGGGSYFRFLPRALLVRALTELEASQRMAVFYFHPYEFHEGSLYVAELTWRQRLKSSYLRSRLLYNCCTSSIRFRLKALLSRFTFCPLGENLDHASVYS